jgi:hypothetical protein
MADVKQRVASINELSLQLCLVLEDHDPDIALSALTSVMSGYIHCRYYEKDWEVLLTHVYNCLGALVVRHDETVN